MTFAGEIQAGPDVATRGHDSARVSVEQSILVKRSAPSKAPLSIVKLTEGAAC